MHEMNDMRDDTEIWHLRTQLLRIKSDLAADRVLFAARRLAEEIKYNPDWPSAC